MRDIGLVNGDSRGVDIMCILIEVNLFPRCSLKISERNFLSKKGTLDIKIPKKCHI